MPLLATIFLLVLVRVAALVMTAPLLGSRAVPIRFRVGIAIVLSLVSLPLIQSHSVLATNVAHQPATILHLAATELVIGFALGLGVTIMFAAAQMAGTVIGQMAGLQLSDLIDPTSGQAGTAVSQLFGVLSLAAFALMGGPELVLGSLLDTFVHLPIGTDLLSGGVDQSIGRVELTSLMIQILRQSFLLTLRAVAPAVVALMISTVTISMIGRAWPQMNLSGIGFGSNVLVMAGSVFLVCGGCVWLFVDDLNSVVELIQGTLIAKR